MSSLLVFNRVYRLEIQSFMLVFSTLLANQRLSNLLTDLPSPLPPSLSEPNKISLPPQTKNQEGRGPQTDKHLSPGPIIGQFRIGVYQLFGPLVKYSSSNPIFLHRCLSLWNKFANERENEIICKPNIIMYIVHCNFAIFVQSNLLYL